MDERFAPHQVSSTRLLWLLFVPISLVMLLVLGITVKNLHGALTMNYNVTAGGLEIRYGITTERIPADQIRRIWTLEQPTGVVRTFGTSTAGLKQGRWTTAETGPILLYATTLRPLLVIETEQAKFGISPADPQALTAALDEGRPGSFAPLRVDGSLAGLWVPIWLTLLLPVLLWVVLGKVFRFPKALQYELGPDGLVIETGWRPITVRYGEIEGVAIAEPKGWPLRLYGTQVTGVLWGKFSWRPAGKNLYLYATRAKPLVLVQLAEKTIGITPADDEGFVAALQRRLG